MKKSVIVVIILLLIVSCSSTVIVLMATGILQKGENTDAGILVDSSENETSYVRFFLKSADVDIVENLEGIVCASEDAVKMYSVTKVNSQFKLHTYAGAYVSKGQPLYTGNDGKIVNAPTDVVVTNIILNNDFYMETFSYDNLKIKLYISEKYQNRIPDIIFTTTGENGEEVKLELSDMDAYVTEGRIGVNLKCPFKLLENSVLNISVKYDTVSDKITIPSEFVFFTESNRAYVHILDDESEDVREYYLDIYSQSEDEYVVNDDLDNCWVGYTQEEKFFNEQ